jgi:catechol 2,3-dioxygenase-like lactoylglutathione lyase family enzyme
VTAVYCDPKMSRHLGCVTMVVDDYDVAVDYFTKKLGFELR